MHLVIYPKHCFQFLLGWLQWKTKVMQNFGGQIRCIMGDVQVAYGPTFKFKIEYVYEEARIYYNPFLSCMNKNISYSFQLGQ